MIDPTQLPCGGCRYCTRAHTNWSKFTEDVDDVVPLGKKVEKTEAHAALSWLFSNDKEVCDQLCILHRWIFPLQTLIYLS